MHVRAPLTGGTATAAFEPKPLLDLAAHWHFLRQVQRWASDGAVVDCGYSVCTVSRLDAPTSGCMVHLSCEKCTEFH